MTRFCFAIGLLAFAGLAGADCRNDGVELQVLGSGGPEYDDGRLSSSYLIRVNGAARLLIDAGPGASVAFGASGAQFEDLDAILLTHLHVDHAGDLSAFVKGSYFSDRRRDLPVYGPAGNELMPATTRFVEGLFGDGGTYRYLREYVSDDRRSDYKVRPADVPLVPGDIERIQLNEDVVVSATHVHHGPVAAIAWRVDIGECSLAFSGDMSNRFDTFSSLAKSVDLLVMHNAVPEDAGRIARNLHMPPSEIGRIASEAGAKRVVLSHFMNRTLGREGETLSEIRKLYEGPVELATDGQRYRLVE